jgi:hypothetical protein
LSERNKGRSIYDIVYTFNQELTEFKEMKVITGVGLKKSKERGVYDKETKKLSDIYYNPKQGY